MESIDTPMKTKTELIPFFPSNLHEKQGKVSVWWFERNFSQSFYGAFASRQCNSCMLIMLLIASRIRIYNIKMKAVQDQLPFDLISVFAESILDGNKIYCTMSNAKKLRDINFSVPDAICAVGKYLRGLNEWFYASIQVLNFANGISESIFSGLTEGYNRWKGCTATTKTENYLFALLIASKQSVLFVFEEKSSTVTVLDSHEHLGVYGSIVVQTDIKNLFGLCHTIERMYLDVSESCPYRMELSFLECNEENPLVYIRKFIPFASSIAY
ncbi:hypothetical protein HA402_014646 [Bradysia odoriphaga]|nr:hypothetical protein HA402_014646 [Bradysia odoriphaga]